MAQKVLSYPLRIDSATGSFAVIDDESDTYKAQQITAFTRTAKGERKILQDYGITDAAFHEFDISAFVDSFSDYYSPDRIRITSIDRKVSSGVTPALSINFS